MVYIEEASTTMTTPRISFSADFLDDDSFISISPGSSRHKDDIDLERSKMVRNGLEFEFSSSKNSCDARDATMLTADELFFQGKLLPSCQINHAAPENLAKIDLRASSDDNNHSDNNQPVYPSKAASDDNSHNNNSVCSNEASLDGVNKNGQPKEITTKQVNESASQSSGILLGREPQEPRIWFVDDDPSPRPPNCTVLWKELLRLKKQRSSTPTMSPSSSSSSSSSSSRSLGDAAVNIKEKDKEKENEKHIKKIKKGGLERTKSSNSIKIRPMFNVPISTQTTSKSGYLTPLSRRI